MARQSVAACTLRMSKTTSNVRSETVAWPSKCSYSQWRRTQPYCATGSSSFAEYCHSCSAKVELTAAACAKNVARWTKREALDVGIMPPHYSPRLTLIVI